MDLTDDPLAGIDSEELEADIDKAIDELFVKKGEPTQPSVAEEAVKEEPVAEPSEEPAPIPPAAPEDESLALLKEKLLTLDWEITSENILSFEEELQAVSDQLAEDRHSLAVIKMALGVLQYLRAAKGSAAPISIQFLHAATRGLGLFAQEPGPTDAERNQVMDKLLGQFRRVKAEIQRMKPVEEVVAEPPVAEEPVLEEIPDDEPILEDLPEEELPLEEIIEEPAPEEILAEEPVLEPPAEEEPTLDAFLEEEPVLAAPPEEMPTLEEISAEEPVLEDLPEEDIPLEELIEEPTLEEISVEEPVSAEPPEDTLTQEEIPEEKPILDELPEEEPALEEIPAEEPVLEPPAEEEPTLDAFLEEEPVLAAPPEEMPTLEEISAEEPVLDDLPEQEPALEELLEEEPPLEAFPEEEPPLEELLDEEPPLEPSEITVTPAATPDEIQTSVQQFTQEVREQIGQLSNVLDALGQESNDFFGRVLKAMTGKPALEKVERHFSGVYKAIEDKLADASKLSGNMAEALIKLEQSLAEVQMEAPAPRDKAEIESQVKIIQDAVSRFTQAAADLRKSLTGRTVAVAPGTEPEPMADIGVDTEEFALAPEEAMESMGAEPLLDLVDEIPLDTPSQAPSEAATIYLADVANNTLGIPTEAVANVFKMSKGKVKAFRKRGYARLADFKGAFRSIKRGITGPLADLKVKELKTIQFPIITLSPEILGSDDTQAEAPVKGIVLLSDGKRHGALFTDEIMQRTPYEVKGYRKAGLPGEVRGTAIIEGDFEINVVATEHVLS